LPSFGDIYRDKKVLVTGNAGFKASWISVWLVILGAKVYGLSNGIPTEPSHFEDADLKDKVTDFVNVNKESWKDILNPLREKVYENFYDYSDRRRIN
jgi:nucleoside-diphosphate-sugar epimerase